jgi:hypothetical protein
MTITGLFNYRSVYAVIALSFLPPMLFLAGLGAIGVFKHVKWLGLTRRALREGARFAAESAAAEAQPTPSTQAAPAGLAS